MKKQLNNIRIIEIGTGYTSIPARIGAATEIVVEELTKSMIKDGKYVTIFDIKDTSRDVSGLPITEVYMPQFFSSADTKLGIVHKMKRILYSISLTYKLHQTIKKEKGKILLHFHNQYNLFFFLKLTPKYMREKLEIMYTNHSYIWQGEWDDIKDIIKKRYFQEIYCCKNADHVYVLNNKTMEHLISKFNVRDSKIHLIPNGVNTNIYYPLLDADICEVAKMNNILNKQVFFQAGSICERKNQLTAVKLLLPLMKKDPSVVFCYAGGIISEEYHQAINEFAKDNCITEQVRYLGELKPGVQLNEYYNIARAFVFPSTSEGFSLVILEAMSAGLPVLVDAQSGLKIPNDGLSGCLSYSGNEDFLIKAEMLLNEDDNKMHGIEARKCVLDSFSWDKIASEYLRNINE